MACTGSTAATIGAQHELAGLVGELAGKCTVGLEAFREEATEDTRSLDGAEEGCSDQSTCAATPAASPRLQRADSPQLWLGAGTWSTCVPQPQFSQVVIAPPEAAMVVEAPALQCAPVLPGLPEGWQWQLVQVACQGPVCGACAGVAPASAPCPPLQAPSAPERRARRRPARPARCPRAAAEVPGAAPPSSFPPARCARLLEDLEAEESRSDVLACLAGNVARLAMESEEGSRLVQRALELAGNGASARLLQELHGRVRELIGSPHANYVIQNIIEKMPPALASFVIRELRGDAEYVACHKFGCRVLCRVLEHSDSGSMEVKELVDEVLERAEAMCRHVYAHHVVEKVLEHGAECQRRRVLFALLSDPIRNAQDRHGHFVFKAALGHCGPEAAHALAYELLCAYGGPDPAVLQLAQTRSGVNLLRSLAELQGVTQMVFTALQVNWHTLAQSKTGRRLLEQAADMGLNGVSEVALMA